MPTDYPLAPDKIEIKEKMFSSYQLKISDIYNIAVGTVKKFAPNFFGKKGLWFTMRTCNSNKG